MVIVKALFVLVLVVPAAVVFYVFFQKMVNEFAVVKKNINTDVDYVSNGRKRTRRTTTLETLEPREKVHDKPKKKGFGKKKKRSEKFAASHGDVPVEHKKAKTRGVTSKKQKRQKVDHSRDTMQLDFSYPKDPYADFKRPDLDQLIRNANERDRINKKKF